MKLGNFQNMLQSNFGEVEGESNNKIRLAMTG